ncbi:MAG: MOSC domain-containing protein [Planctomycetota bacterium]
MPVVTSVCMSREKGTPKKAVERARAVTHVGFLGDAHAGTPGRQVSMLAEESVDKMRGKGMDLAPGAFGENVNTRGIDLLGLAIGTRLRVGPAALLELTVKGKVCHDRCAIYEAIGDCVMPREGVFFEVIEGGEIAPGHEIVVLEGEGRP